MTSIREILLSEENRPLLVDDGVVLVDSLVKKRKGMKAMALKGAYTTVKAIRGGFIRGVVDSLIDEWVDSLEMFHNESQLAGDYDAFEGYLNNRQTDVAEELLKATDARAETTKYNTVRKLYLKFRPGALSQVEEGVPDLSALIVKHLKGEQRA